MLSSPKSPLLPEDNGHNNSSKQTIQIKQSSYGETVKLETIIESICGIVYFILFLIMSILFVIGIAINNNTVYKASYIGLLSYQMVTVSLCLYYCCRFEFVAIKKIITFNKFWVSCILSFLFNIISFILISLNISDDWDILLCITYLFGAFSIPMPTICIKLNHEYKYNKQNKFMLSPTTSVAAGLPMFNDNILKFSICCCYIAHLVIYIMNATHNFSIDMYDSHKIMYSVNEICLRPWMGMALTSVIFVLVTELTDKQLVSTGYKVLHQLYSDENVCNYNCSGRRIIILTLLVVSIVFECIPTNKTHEPLIHQFINSIWILIHIICSLFLLNYICLFSGIYSKTRYKFQKSNNSTRPSPIKSFVMEGLFVLCLYLVYIICLFIENYNVNDQFSSISFNIYRQVSILILLSLQFITLIRLKQIQKFGTLYVKRFNKYRHSLGKYYQFMCFLLVYNSLYIFIFGVTFFKYQTHNGFALTFSFSVITAICVNITHFLYSYKKWKKDEIDFENYDEAEEKTRHSVQIVSEHKRKQSSGADLSSHEYESIVSK
eukprot:212685_1